jgi:hypothetical protein
MVFLASVMKKNPVGIREQLHELEKEVNWGIMRDNDLSQLDNGG